MILVILFWLLVGVLVLFAILLCTPIHLRVVLRSDPKPAFDLEVRVISGNAPRLFRVGKSLRKKQGQRGLERSERSGPDGKAQQRKEDRKWISRRKLSGLAGKIPPLVADTFSGVHFDEINLRGEFGLSDPADTGRTYGYITPLVYAPQSTKFSVDVVPNFETPCFRGQGMAALHFVPIRLAQPTLQLLWREFVVAR